MSNQKNSNKGYAIPRSNKPLIVQTITMIIVSDTLYVFTLLSFIGLRNALGLDAQLIGLALALFIFKTIITIYSIYIILRQWLGISYFVSNGQLHIASEIRNVPSTIFALKDISKAVSSDSYSLLKKREYGSVVVSFTHGAVKENITLQSVKNPGQIANLLSKK